MPLDTTQGAIRRNIGGRMRRERELAGGIITSKMNRAVIDETVEETESASRSVGLGVCALPSAQWILPALAFVGSSAP